MYTFIATNTCAFICTQVHRHKCSHRHIYFPHICSSTYTQYRHTHMHYTDSHTYIHKYTYTHAHTGSQTHVWTHPSKKANHSIPEKVVYLPSISSPLEINESTLSHTCLFQIMSSQRQIHTLHIHIQTHVQYTKTHVWRISSLTVFRTWIEKILLVIVRVSKEIHLTSEWIYSFF
jgi:hypothetical protein